MDQMASKAQIKLKTEIDRSVKLFKDFPLTESSLDEIEQLLFENTFKNFVDPEFPPN